MAQVNSYNVANRSGAQVRGDINDIFDAIKTCNSGNSDPAAPAKFMLYGDSASGDDNLRIYDGISQFRPIGKVTEDNLGLLPRSGGTMTGPLLIDDSSNASTPALSFDTNTDLGLFLKGANQMGFASSGTEQLFMDGNGITLNTQKEIRFSDSNNYVGIKAPSTVSSTNKTITLPDETGTLLTSASSIANSNLANSSITVGSTAINLGATASTITGLTTLQTTNIKDTSGNKTSTPEQIAQGRAKAWINFDGTLGTTANQTFNVASDAIRGSFNVSSITDHGGAIYTINFSTAMEDTNYCEVATGFNTGVVFGAYAVAMGDSSPNHPRTTEKFAVTTMSSGNTPSNGSTQECKFVLVAVFGNSAD